MAAPEHVPVDRNRPVRAYESPPRRPDPWLSERPGEVVHGGQPRGDRLGHQGPDQGYALRLARRFEGELQLTSGEHEKDALAGAVAVALTVWGFLGEAPSELVALRKPLFEEVWHPHRYAELGRLADLVPEEVLRMSPAEVGQVQRTDWRRLLGDLPTASR